MHLPENIGWKKSYPKCWWYFNQSIGILYGTTVLGKRGTKRKHLTLPIYRLTQRGLHGVHRCLAQRCKGVNRGSCCLKGIINNKGITIVSTKKESSLFQKKETSLFQVWIMNETIVQKGIIVSKKTNHCFNESRRNHCFNKTRNYWFKQKESRSVGNTFKSVNWGGRRERWNLLHFLQRARQCCARCQSNRKKG